MKPSRLRFRISLRTSFRAFGQRGRCPSWICGGGLRVGLRIVPNRILISHHASPISPSDGGLRVERVGEFALEAGGRVLRHAVGAVLSPLGERQLTERVLADAVEVPAPKTAVIMISAEYGYGYAYRVEDGVEEGVGSHAYAHARTGYGSGFFFPFFFFFLGGCGGKGFFFFFPFFVHNFGGGLRLGLRIVPK